VTVRDLVADGDAKGLLGGWWMKRLSGRITTATATAPSAAACPRRAAATMLYFIGLGLGDEKDITLRGLEAVRRCSHVFLESYTSLLGVDKDALVRLPRAPHLLPTLWLDFSLPWSFSAASAWSVMLCKVFSI